jgi:hypothetical protein
MVIINPLNTELNPISYLLVLLEAHPILHVSRIRVNVETKYISSRKVNCLINLIDPVLLTALHVLLY